MCHNYTIKSTNRSKQHATCSRWRRRPSQKYPDAFQITRAAFNSTERGGRLANENWNTDSSKPTLNVVLNIHTMSIRRQLLTHHHIVTNTVVKSKGSYHSALFKFLDVVQAHGAVRGLQREISDSDAAMPTIWGVRYTAKMRSADKKAVSDSAALGTQYWESSKNKRNYCKKKTKVIVQRVIYAVGTEWQLSPELLHIQSWW